METFLGLLGLAAFIIAVVALAAGVTYSVVRLTPEREDKAESPAK
jgi:predicted lysophospholipase L1 biosynthesis ABC-type transport system permease subunit